MRPEVKKMRQRTYCHSPSQPQRSHPRFTFFAVVLLLGLLLPSPLSVAQTKVPRERPSDRPVDAPRPVEPEVIPPVRGTSPDDAKGPAERPRIRPRVLTPHEAPDVVPEAVQVRRRLRELLDREARRGSVGLVVLDLADDRVWAAINAEKPFKPASVLKLFTTAAALLHFGERFEYETRIYVHRRPHERGLADVWVVGAGDPAIGDPRFAQQEQRLGSDLLRDWADALIKRGVAEVDTLYLDDTIFDRELRNPDWPEDQMERWYQAPIGGLCLNDNCLDATIELRERVPVIIAEPPLPRELLVNELVLSRQHNPRVRRAVGADLFEFFGGISRSERLESITCNDPTLFFGYSLREVLERRGVAVRRVARGAMPPAVAAEARPAVVHTTRLEDVLWRCNTFSQNLFAECLLKTLAAYTPDGRRIGSGSRPDGLEVLTTTLERAGVDLSDAVIRDGCGLSHRNRLTAAQVVQLLHLMRHEHPRLRDVFEASLAVAGAEAGSMRRRYDDPGIRGRIRGKTGSISGVSTLAGYVDRGDGRTLAFALLQNGAGSDTVAVEVCRILVGDAQPIEVEPRGGRGPGRRQEPPVRTDTNPRPEEPQQPTGSPTKRPR